MKRILSALALACLVPLLAGSSIVINSYRFAAAGGGTPTVSSATIQAGTTGLTTLTLNFSESCTNGAGGSGGITVSPSGGASTAAYSSGSPGSAFTYSLTRQILSGETVTRSYTQPGNGIEATTGGIDLATFTTQAVTNNSNVVVYDDYAGTGALSGNYTDVIPGISRVSGVASATGTDPAGITAYTGLTPSANCRASITLTTAPDATHTFNIYLRFDVATGNGYGCVLDSGSTLTIYRFDANVPTSLGATTVAYSSSDVFGAAISGSIVTILKNGTTALTGSSDATYSTAQPVAIGMIGTGATTITFDNLVIQNLP